MMHHVILLFSLLKLSTENLRNRGFTAMKKTVISFLLIGLLALPFVPSFATSNQHFDFSHSLVAPASDRDLIYEV